MTTELINSLEANGTRFMRDFNKEEISKRQGAHLPHWTIDSAVYHLRFSLIDAIPGKVRVELLKEKEIILAKLKNDSDLTGLERKKLKLLYYRKVESTLDAGYGSCWLADEKIATLVSNALAFFDGDRYCIFAWVVMPNHVHAVFQPAKSYKLPQILHSWKSFTANKANKILGRSGGFWLNQYFDHLIRDESRLIECIEYVYKNPEASFIKPPLHRYKIC
jgi:menaquinone-specific isochorismate synthase